MNPSIQAEVAQVAKALQQERERYAPAAKNLPVKDARRSASRVRGAKGNLGIRDRIPKEDRIPKVQQYD
jgi:hypothetical protein